MERSVYNIYKGAIVARTCRREWCETPRAGRVFFSRAVDEGAVQTFSEVYQFSDKVNKREFQELNAQFWEHFHKGEKVQVFSFKGLSLDIFTDEILLVNHLSLEVNGEPQCRCLHVRFTFPFIVLPSPISAPCL